MPVQKAHIKIGIRSPHGDGRTTKVRRSTAMPQQQPRAIFEFIIPFITPGLTFSIPLHTECMLDGRATD